MSEPTPDRQPSDAAVEAALVEDQVSWHKIPEYVRAELRLRMHAALEAAYRVDAPRPLLHQGDVFAALDEVYTSGAMGGEWSTLGTDAVMELARPMPTDAELTEWLRGVELSGGQLTDAYVTEDEARTLAAAVLAKLTEKVDR